MARTRCNVLGAGNVPQCGYCQPGQIMQAAALLRQTRSQPRNKSLTPCRGTYAGAARTCASKRPSSRLRRPRNDHDREYEPTRRRQGHCRHDWPGAGFHVGSRNFPFAEAATPATFEPNVYLAINETGLVTIVAHRSEMGTGIRTGLPMVLATNSRPTGRASGSFKLRAIRNTGIRTPMGRAACDSFMNRCAWPAPRQDRCSKPPRRMCGASTRMIAARAII